MGRASGMSDLAVSVVVVSRGRPESLSLCLTSLAQQEYALFEIVVVADKAGLRRLGNRPDLFGRVKQLRFDEPNISAARNLGITRAAGEVVAFIDDDAVAEPLWLAHLAAPFADADVAAATGFVRDPDGMRLQWAARDVGPDAASRPLEADSPAPFLLEPGGGRGVKLEGTNMAVRRSVFEEIGGFDPAYRFYLDETDLSRRLVLAEKGVAVVPRAQVQHGLAASERRRADRVPLSLHEVGASLAVWQRRYETSVAKRDLLGRERRARRRSLLAHMVAGRIEPRDVRRVLATLDKGYVEGQSRRLADPPRLGPAEVDFMAFHPVMRRRPHRLVAGRIWQRRGRRRLAAELARRGHVVSLVLLGPTRRRHRLRYLAVGVWEQTGGLFGPSEADDPQFRAWSFRDRVRRELRRVEDLRRSALWRTE